MKKKHLFSPFSLFISLFLLLVLSATSQVVAQSLAIGQDNIVFHSSQAVNNGNTLSMSNDFIIRGSQEIEWSQDNGNEKFPYEITGTSGTWKNLNENGEIEFQVRQGQRTGKIVLSRNGGSSIKLRIETYRGTVNLVPFEFIISSFEKLN